MKKKQRGATLKTQFKDLLKIVSDLSNNLNQFNKRIEKLEEKKETLQPTSEEITGMKMINKLPGENLESISKRFPDRGASHQSNKLPDFISVEAPIAYKQVLSEILPGDFKMTFEEMTDRAEYRIAIIVPDSYRSQSEIDAYHSKHEQNRADYRNELTSRNENISEEELNKKIEAWDTIHDKVVIPPDKRTFNVSKTAGLGINQFREKLIKIKKNILGTQDQVLTTNN